MDPETGVDAVSNVGIRDGKIVRISSEALRGRRQDRAGCVPGPCTAGAGKALSIARLAMACVRSTHARVLESHGTQAVTPGLYRNYRRRFNFSRPHGSMRCR
jgi:hypothetical protein